jgi:hypothetical protein
MDDDRRPHRLRVGFPPTSRTLDIGDSDDDPPPF